MAIIVLMSALWFTSHTQNQSAMAELSKKVEVYEKTASTHPQSDFSALLARLNAIQQVSTVFAGKPAWTMTFGLYEGDELQPLIKEKYNELLQKQLLPLIKVRLEQHIQDENTHEKKYSVLYPLMQVYFMLGGREKLDPEALKSLMTVEWEVIYPTDIDSRTQLLAHLDNLLKLPLDKKQQLDDDLINTARQILNRTSVAEQIYIDIKTDARQETSGQDFNLAKALGSNADKIFTTERGSLAQQTIPYLFTYKGFYATFLKKLKSTEQIQDAEMRMRILGKTANQNELDTANREKDILDFYYTDYIKAWQGLLDNLKIIPLSNAKQASIVLGFASDLNNSPLRKLLEVLNKETSLTVLPLGAEDAVKKLSGSASNSSMAKFANAAKSEVLPSEKYGQKVEDNFQELTVLVRPNNTLLADMTTESLKPLFSNMVSLSSPNVAGQAVANTGAAQTLKIKSNLLPEPLKSMTQKMATESEGIILTNGSSQLNQLWQREVLSLYQKGIQGRYPFSKGSSKEVGLGEFSQIFAQGGSLEQFFNTNSKSLSAPALAKLQNVMKIRQLFFTAGGTTPLLRFYLKPVSVSSNASRFWLNIGGQQAEYTQTSPSVTPPSFQWTGTDASRAVSFGFETIDGKKLTDGREGTWALFQVLEMAHIQKQQDKYQLTFEIEGSQAVYELRIWLKITSRY